MSMQEQILVIPRSLLFEKNPAWHGVNNKVTQDTIQTITDHQKYIVRATAETDPSYKQIIPYMVFCFNNKYFVMQRKASASEQRLAGKLSLGIGGHMRQEDIAGKTIFDWAAREFEEEVHFTGKFDIEPLGVLNDDSNEVGKVHLGLVLLLHGDSDAISIKDEHKSGILMSKQECLQKLESFENWSQLILPMLP